MNSGGVVYKPVTESDGIDTFLAPELIATCIQLAILSILLIVLNTTVLEADAKISANSLIFCLLRLMIFYLVISYLYIIPFFYHHCLLFII